MTLDEAVQYVRGFKVDCNSELTQEILDAASTLERAVAYYRWADAGDAGISSKTIVEVISGISLCGMCSEPLDDDDFGRCIRVLQRFPELRPNLHKVADAYPEWRALVDAWDELEALYESDRERLRERLEDLRNGRGEP